MKRPKVTGLRRRESWQALPFLLPSLLGLCLFYLFPLAETVRASFMPIMMLMGNTSIFCILQSIINGCLLGLPEFLHEKSGSLVLYQQTAIKDLESLFLQSSPLLI